jgi:signal transduction histidine kinase
MSEETDALQILLSAFPDLPDDEAQELIQAGKVCTYSPDTILCQEDATESTFYIILDGKVNVTKVVDPVDNEVRLLKTLTAGGFFGEMALVQDAPRAATVTTVLPTTVLEIQKQQFDHLMHSSASVSRAMVKEVVRRLRENDTMAIEDLRLKAGELAAAYQQLAEQEYARREFLTTIAHELRTPLTAASGFLQMIEMGLMRGQGLDSEAQQAAIRTASRHIQQIVALVNDILFVQEMDLILPRFEKLALSQLIATAIERGQAQQAESQVRVALNLAPDLPAVYGDARSLERALAAIFDNAFKFSYPGGVVEVKAMADGDYVWAVIRDDGVGIPDDVQDRIFDRFFHIDQIEGRMFRGLGLGLSIARQVIEQHHGIIQVRSKPGKGTTVWIGLKAASEG